MQGSWRIRRPHPGEWRAVSRLVLRSKAFWGYSDDFLAHFAPGMTVPPRTLATADCLVAAQGPWLLGYGVRRGGRLDDLFVAPEAMGRGIGRTLLDRLRRHARAAGHAGLVFDADPFAVGFYRRQGARVVGWTPSPWPGDPSRRLPRMRLPVRRTVPCRGGYAAASASSG